MQFFLPLFSLGQKLSQCIRDNLPSKLSASIKQSQEKAMKHMMLMPQNGGSRGDVHVEDNQNMSFPSWEGTFMRWFSEIDEKLAKNIDTDGFRGGSTSVSVIKQGDQVIIGNVGDSRAVLCRRAPDNHLIPVQLTVDLTPDIPREAMRIFAVEEDPTVNRVWMPKRDCPGLAMARAFRNFCLKDYGVASVPDVS
ncbi:hypothetical protein AAZV13_03G038100 [Glycine max]|uniref:PPM-type phosphatase domain-containing protein n=1 Tax=Glycine soja TaxID=3848 RepID=A0A445L7F9_GLYSO|nr:putative protein phosphatase 2C 14 isoform A [Glycine soja]RZC19076.1 putative protein phosphatase 2C 14 isoform B [Glycine soja]RZC19077.1 putative protein phosphatase 2C 14 isoform C [Glycine soja]RZC19080.1 putative protein phosphatase 2C 14 isoform F [Glycine soja]